MLLVKNTVKYHCLIHSTACCSYQSVERTYKIIVLHVGTASPPEMDKTPTEMKCQRADIDHLGSGCRQVQQHISVAVAELLGNVTSCPKARLEGNLYIEFNRLILKLITWVQD